MDIFQVLEAIRSQDHVVNVQLLSDKTAFNSNGAWGTAITSVASTLVAGLAIYFSYKSTNRNRESQEKSTKLNAIIQTDIELKKEWCRELRKLCSECIAQGTEVYSATRRKEFMEKLFIDGKGLDSIQYNKVCDHLNWSFYKMFEAEASLSLYLEPVEHSAFISSISEFTVVASNKNNSPENFANARARCISLCQKLLADKREEISKVALKS